MKENQQEKKKPGRKPKYVYLDKFDKVIDSLHESITAVARSSDENFKIISNRLLQAQKTNKILARVLLGLIAIYCVDLLVRFIIWL